MNERIEKALMTVEFKSGFEVRHDEEYGQVLENFTLRDAEKFARLIIEECFGEIICQLYDYDPSSSEQYNAGHEAGLRLAASKIKEHFGVEE